jgi:hypothetical protein
VFTLSDLRDLALRKRLLSPVFTGQSVVYRRANGEELTLEVHVRHQQRPEEDDEGRGELVQVAGIEVRIMRADVAGGPQRGDRVILAYEERAYVYAYTLREDQWTWTARYERAITPAIAGRESRTLRR